jgi:hypothetical protein
VDGLKDWDVSNVQYFSYIFTDSELSDASGLIDWNTSKAKALEQTFRGTKLRNLHGLENWDISGLNYMFVPMSISLSLAVLFYVVFGLLLAGWINQ